LQLLWGPQPPDYTTLLGLLDATTSLATTRAVRTAGRQDEIEVRAASMKLMLLIDDRHVEGLRVLAQLGLSRSRLPRLAYGDSAPRRPEI